MRSGSMSDELRQDHKVPSELCWRYYSRQLMREGAMNGQEEEEYPPVPQYDRSGPQASQELYAFIA